MTPGEIIAAAATLLGILTTYWQFTKKNAAEEHAAELANQLEVKKVELAGVSEKQKADESAWKRVNEMLDGQDKRIAALEADKRRLEDEALAERQACAGLIEKAQDEMQAKLRAMRVDTDAYQATLLNSIRALRVTCEDQETQLASLKIINIRLQGQQAQDAAGPKRRATDPVAVA